MKVDRITPFVFMKTIKVGYLDMPVAQTKL